MKHHSSLYAVVGAAFMLACGPTFAADEAAKPNGNTATATAPQPEVDIKKLSEAFGHFIGKNLKSSGLNFDVDNLIQGIKDGVAGKPAPMNEKDYEKGMMALQEKALKKLAEDNLKAANDYLKTNVAKGNIVELVPGKLQYMVLDQGTGATVQEHGSPSIQYKGQYIDGTVFGSSEESGGPLTLSLDQTIPGFAKALVGMKEGEKRRIFVHPELGYGTSGHLPPNSLLIFDVEIIKADNADKDHSASFNYSPGDDSIAQADLPKKPGTSSSKATDPKSKKDMDDEDDDDDYDDDDDDDEDYDEEDPAPPTKKAGDVKPVDTTKPGSTPATPKK